MCVLLNNGLGTVNLRLKVAAALKNVGAGLLAKAVSVNGVVG